MALPLRTEEIAAATERAGEVIVVEPTRQFESCERTSGRAEALNDYRAAAAQIVARARQSAGAALAHTRARTREIYGNVSYSAKALARRAQSRTRQVRQERPLQALAVIAASAFIVGAAIRIWRSRR